jgi:hypothetical protein
MTHVLISEHYLADAAEQRVDLITRNLEDAAEELASAGTRIRLLRALFVPFDETYFAVYDAESADAVRKAAALAQCPFERVVRAVLLETRAALPVFGNFDTTYAPFE